MLLAPRQQFCVHDNTEQRRKLLFIGAKQQKNASRKLLVLKEDIKTNIFFSLWHFRPSTNWVPRPSAQVTWLIE